MRGYRINYPEESTAWKVLNFEYDSGNDHYELDVMTDLNDFLGGRALLRRRENWEKLLSAFRERYGDAEGVWLTYSRREAILFYGDYGGTLLEYEYDPKLVISDLGGDGFFVVNAKLIREETLEEVKDND